MLNKIKKIISVPLALSVVFSSVYAADFKDGGFENVSTDTQVSVGNPVYTTGGVALDGAISSNQKINISLPVYTDAQKTLTAITTLNDENNSVIDITYARETNTGDFELESSINASSAFESGKYTLKTYLWDDLALSYIYAGNFSFKDINAPSNKNTAWNVSGAASLSSEKVFEGLSALKIKSADYISDTKVTQNIEVKANKVYKLDFAAVGDGNFSYDITDTDGNTLLNEICYFDGSEDWTFPSKAVFSVEEDAAVTAVFADCGTNAVSYIDNVSLTEELLSNGSFEYGLSSFDTMGTYTLSDVTSDGDFAVYMKNAYVKQPVSLVGDMVYTMSASLKGDDAYLKVLNSDGDVIAFKLFDTSNVYSSNSMDFYVQESGEYFVEVRAEGSTYVDCVSVKAASDELVLNGKFLEGQDLWRVRGGVGSASIVDGIDGSMAFCLTGRTQYYHGIAHQVADRINNYGIGRYKVSCYAKYADENMSNGILTLGFTGQYENKDKGTATKNYTKQIQGLSSEWNYFETVFDITTFGTDEFGNELMWCPSNTTSEGALYFETGNGDANGFCITNVSMTALDKRKVYPEYGTYDGPGEPSEAEPEPEPEPEPELIEVDVISNGSFDEGKYDGWNMRGNNSDTKLTIISPGANDTAYGLELSGRNVYYTGVYQSLKTALNTYGKRVYKLSGYVRFTEGTDAADVKAVIQTTAKNGSVPAKMYTYDIKNVTGEWKYFEYEFDINRFLHENGGEDIDEITQKDSSCALYFETKKDNLRTFAIDNISLKTYFEAE